MPSPERPAKLSRDGHPEYRAAAPPGSLQPLREKLGKSEYLGPGEVRDLADRADVDRRDQVVSDIPRVYGPARDTSRAEDERQPGRRREHRIKQRVKMRPTDNGPRARW